MPKPIKKHAPHHHKSHAQSDALTLMEKFQDLQAEHGKQLYMAILAVLALVVVVLGIRLYTAKMSERAAESLYDGYKLLYDPYGNLGGIPQERLAQAVEKFDEAYGASKGPAPLYYKALALDEMKDVEGTREALGRLLAEYPADPRFAPLAKYKLAMIEVRSGQAEKALATLDELRKMDSIAFDDMALAERARLLRTLGRQDEARAAYEELLSGFPDSPLAEEARANTQAPAPAIANTPAITNSPAPGAGQGPEPL